MTRPWRMRCVRLARKEASIEYADGGNMSIVEDPVSTATADALEAILDRAGRHGRGDGAGEAREHGHEGLAVEAHPAHHPVDEEGHPGQVPAVF